MIYNGGRFIEDDIVIDEESASNKKIQKKTIYKFAVIVLMTLAMSGISISSGIYPIGFVMLGVASAFNVPLLIVAAVATLSMLIFGVSLDVIVPYLFFFVLFTLATAILNVNGLSKKYAVLIKIMLCMAIVNLVQVIFMSYSLLNFLICLFSVSASYIIFVHGTSVIINIRKGYVFSQEEKVSALAILAFILSIFGNINIMGVHIANIIAIMAVLIYGYKQGAIAGCVSGFIIGLIMCLVSNINISFIATLGAGGLIARTHE